MRIIFATPGDLSARTGGYGYDRAVIAALPEFNVEVAHVALQGSFPFPSEAEAREAARAINAALAPRDVALIDGLAYGALPEDAIRAIAAPVLALCHHPLGLEHGLDPARAKALLRSEAAALALAAHVIVTSAHTRKTLIEDFGVSSLAVTVAPPGTAPVARASGSGGGTILLAVGSIIARKGFDILVEALAGLAQLDWRLRLVGGAPAPETANALARLIEARGLGARIDWLGEISAEALDGLYDSSDIFVSSSLYEGYGMALAEALARGLPIVTTTGGACVDTAPDDAALKVAPGDVDALREALRRMIEDRELRRDLSEASWRAGQKLPRWRDTARTIGRAARAIAPAVAP
ncbi:MAG TPA: glycosyltransferase family 4 protein [Methylocystis sp.]